jgi:prolipoprotein diacylglyceryl transferase
MLLPIAFTPDGVKMVGYAGLASHGGTIGIFIAILMYCKKYKVKLLEVVDMICVATPFTAGCIRIGNLMNSEIVGKATGTDWGFIFAALGEDFPRHPAQLYEAIAYFIIFIISIFIYKKHKDMVGSGFYFGFCLATIFTFRFFVEFCKEVQVDFEEGMALDMGQILSIPFMLIGAYFIYRGIKLKIKAKK